MKVEDQVTQASCIYIHSITYNFENKKIIISFIENPEGQQQFKRLIFTDVYEFSETIDKNDFDEDCLDSIIGIQESQHNALIKYIVTTEQREMEIYTENVPLIEDIE